MRDIIEKAMLFGGKAIVTVMRTKNIVERARELHDTSAVATAALGRTLTAITFMSMDMEEDDDVSAIVDGGGALGKIIVSGAGGGYVRGYVGNGSVELPLNAKGKLDVGGAVGRDGYLTVTKKIGGGEPYVGKCELMSGEIGEDFAYYYLISEQLPSVVALGTLIENGKCISAGGVFIQPLPGCGEDILVVLEDISRNFKDISKQLLAKSPREMIDDNFGHFEIKYLDTKYPEYRCRCSREKLESVILSLGKDEAMDMIRDNGEIRAHCEFCNTDYVFGENDVKKLFL